MKFLLQNGNWSLSICLNLLRLFGFLVPGNHSFYVKIFVWSYWFFWFVFIDGIYIIIQFGDVLQIWGDLPLMVNTCFLLLFTNVAFAVKIFIVAWRRDLVQKIIDEGDQDLRNEERVAGRIIINECNRETSRHLRMYLTCATVSVSGWAAGTEEHSLPTRAWYPFDANKSPAYEIAFIHQSIALVLIAAINISMDTLVTSLMAICRCRLRLLKLTLQTLCRDIQIKDNSLMSSAQDAIVSSRLRECVAQHQAALRSAEEIQLCFTEPILGQFTVSMFIICVTAYQLAIDLHDLKNVVYIVAMTSYFFGMNLQVFLYCYQGHQLSDESSEIAYAAYQCDWFACSLKVRRALLLVMVRSRRAAKVTAGGFTTLSLACFTSIIKASYTFFTVLQQVE